MPADRSAPTVGPGDDEFDAGESVQFTLEVGRRLRSIRHQHGLSLQQVENMSQGRWSAATIGAYERGFRTLNLPRLHELAVFYKVPMTVLLGQGPTSTEPVPPRRHVIDLAMLEASEVAPVMIGYLHRITRSRGDWNGAVLSIRDSDMWALAALMGTDEGSLIHVLTAQGVLVDTQP